MQFRGFITFVISTMKFDACSCTVAYFITRIEWSWLQILINNKYRSNSRTAMKIIEIVLSFLYLFSYGIVYPFI